MKETLCVYIAFLKALQTWFHAAHHVAHGCSQAGDHALLYGVIYVSLGETLDGAIEKSIALTDCVDIADPYTILHSALEVLDGWKSPHLCGSDELAMFALEYEMTYLDVVEAIFASVERSGKLTLGLNDFLSASANEHEGFVYKLKQRSKPN